MPHAGVGKERALQRDCVTASTVGSLAEGQPCGPERAGILMTTSRGARARGEARSGRPLVCSIAAFARDRTKARGKGVRVGGRASRRCASRSEHADSTRYDAGCTRIQDQLQQLRPCASHARWLAARTSRVPLPSGLRSHHRKPACRTVGLGSDPAVLSRHDRPQRMVTEEGKNAGKSRGLPSPAQGGRTGERPPLAKPLPRHAWTRPRANAEERSPAALSRAPFTAAPFGARLPPPDPAEGREKARRPPGTDSVCKRAARGDKIATLR